MGNSLDTHSLVDQLCLAAESGNLSSVETLLSKGANINGRGERGETPLHGKTPLMRAAANGHERVVSLLLSKGADFNATGDAGWTPLMKAAANGHERIVSLLLSKGANVNGRGGRPDGDTPLIQAVLNGHERIVSLLLSKGADINASGDLGTTALMSAVFKGYEPIVSLLLSKGADINAKNNRGNTPLILASYSGRERIVSLLLSRGAEINIKDNSGDTALDWATNYHKGECARLLQQAAKSKKGEKKEKKEKKQSPKLPPSQSQISSTSQPSPLPPPSTPSSAEQEGALLKTDQKQSSEMERKTRKIDAAVQSSLSRISDRVDQVMTSVRSGANPAPLSIYTSSLDSIFFKEKDYIDQTIRSLNQKKGKRNTDAFELSSQVEMAALLDSAVDVLQSSCQIFARDLKSAHESARNLSIQGAIDRCLDQISRESEMLVDVCIQNTDLMSERELMRKFDQIIFDALEREWKPIEGWALTPEDRERQYVSKVLAGVPAIRNNLWLSFTEKAQQPSVASQPRKEEFQIEALSMWLLSTFSKLSVEKADDYAAKFVEGGVYSVEMLRALCEREVLSVDRLVNEMKFLRPVAQIIQKANFSPISGHIDEDDLIEWLKLSLGDLPQPVMKETILALDKLGYFTLEMLRGDEELTLAYLVNEGKVNEFIAHTLLLNLNRERRVISHHSSPSSPTSESQHLSSPFFVEGKPISINNEKSNTTAGNFYGSYMLSRTRLENVFVKVKNEDRDLEHEFNILMELNQRGGTSFLHAIDFCSDLNLSYLVLEDFGVNLCEMMQNRILPSRKVIVLQLLDAVANLHRYGVMHGDIKPQNILCHAHNDSLKLCDFDSARHVGEVFPRRPNGRLKYTSAWVSPEVFLADRERGSTRASLSIDVFSVGLLVEVLCRRTCFASSTALPTVNEDPDYSLLHHLLTNQDALYARMEGLRETHLHSSLLLEMLQLDPRKRETVTIHSIQETYRRLMSGTAGMTERERIAEDLDRERKRNEVLETQLLRGMESLLNSNESLRGMVQSLSRGDVQMSGLEREQFLALNSQIQSLQTSMKLVESIPEALFGLQKRLSELQQNQEHLLRGTHHIPTLMIILPKIARSSSNSLFKRVSKMNPLAYFRDEYTLYFLCSHTRQISRCGPDGKGYPIKVWKDWLVRTAPVLKLGLILLKMALTIGVGPIPIPGLLEILGADPALHLKYLDRAFKLVQNPLEDARDDLLETMIDGLPSMGESGEMLSQLQSSMSTEGSQQAYETIRALLESDGHNILATCGLRKVIHGGRVGWVLDKDEIEEAFKVEIDRENQKKV